MATQTTDRTLQYVPARSSDGDDLFVDVATFEAAATPSGDVIQMVKVGRAVTLVDLKVTFDALGAGVTLAVGDGDAAAGFIAATSAAAAGTLRMSGFPKTYSADDTIDVTIGGAAATGTITLTAIYTQQGVDLA